MRAAEDPPGVLWLSPPALSRAQTTLVCVRKSHTSLEHLFFASVTASYTGACVGCAHRNLVSIEAILRALE